MVVWGKKGVKVSPLFCDRLSFVLQYKTMEERTFVRERLKHLKYNSQGHYAHDGGKAKYKLGMYFYVEQYEQVEKMLVQADPHVLSDHFVRVDYNPAHVDSSNVRWLLSPILPGGWMDIPTRAVCTRFDATVDISGMDVADLFVSYPKMRRSRVFCKGGKTETYELGGYAGDKRVLLYDKCAEIKHWNLKHKIKVPLPPSPMARLEIVLRPSIKFDALLQLDNQFSGLRLHPIPPLSETTTTLFRFFVETARFRGLQDALLMLPEGTRKRFKAVMEKSAYSWWDADTVWSTWPILIQELLQVQVQGLPSNSDLAEETAF
jgi:hypothetical protein